MARVIGSGLKMVEFVSDKSSVLGGSAVRINAMTSSQVGFPARRGWNVGVRACATSPTAPTRKPRGITKPKPISPELQEFVGAPEIARTQALKVIWAHIKAHNLQDPNDKKIIVCDEKLKKIFAGKERIGFLEVSKLITPHFL